MTYAGRCACGKVTLAISGEPLATRQCWCRQCRRAAGGGPAHNAMFRAEDAAIAGEMASNTYVAASGNALTQWFCPLCGTPIYAQSSARPQFRTIRFGVLDEPHDLKPEMAIWTDDAPDWAVIDPAMKQYARQPPPPGAVAES